MNSFEVIEVTKYSLDSVVRALSTEQDKGFDTETTGVGFTDLPFVLTIATMDRVYFFDLREVTPPDNVLSGRLFSHNAKFDINMLWKVGIKVPGSVHCTLVAERLIKNDRLAYSLEKVAPLYGYKKDESLNDYIAEHGLREKRTFMGEVVETVPLFNKVPKEILMARATSDAWLHLQIGLKQLEKLNESI